jgi:hypothetical protein
MKMIHYKRVQLIKVAGDVWRGRDQPLLFFFLNSLKLLVLLIKIMIFMMPFRHCFGFNDGELEEALLPESNKLH